MEHLSKNEAFRQGMIVFIFLAVLTALEFFIAIAIGAVILLAAVAVLKVSLVVYYYMHISKLSQESVEDRESQEYKTLKAKFDQTSSELAEKTKKIKEPPNHHSQEGIRRRRRGL